MNSRERVFAAIHHQEPDRVPLDFGATGQTGISASVLYQLRKALHLPEHPIEISEMFQLLGKVEPDLMELLGVDVIGLNGRSNMFGVPNGPLKPFSMPDGTPALISGKNELDILEDGTTLIYPQGDRSVPPSGHMPPNGYFFDNIDRTDGFDEDSLAPAEDFRDSFSVISEDDALYFEKESKRLFEETEYAIIGNLGGAGLGDAAWIPGPNEKHPKGIRRMEDWLMAHLLYPDYIKEVFSMQTECVLKNLEIYRQAVGDRIQIVWLSGTDFGTQNAEFFSRDVFRELYKPFYQKINDWVHSHTEWKTFYHSCGSIVNFLDDFVEMGVDILNPVQLSAKGMDLDYLKTTYGNKLTFWGGGIDTQTTLPFGTPEEIRQQVLHRLSVLSQGGGYVFNTIHNVVGGTPVEHLIAMFNAYREFCGKEPLR